jgi:hypothetical protein
MQYNLLYYKGKRPTNSASDLKSELILYLREEYFKGHLPSKRELQNKFHLRLDISMENLYTTAGLEYKSLANQDIKSKKAKLLLDLIVNNLNLLGLELKSYLKRGKGSRTSTSVQDVECESQ